MLTFKEIVAAAKLCKDRGIELLGFTKHPQTPLGQLLTYFIPMDSPNCDTMFAQYFMLVLALLEKRGDYDGYSRAENARRHENEEGVLRGRRRGLRRSRQRSGPAAHCAGSFRPHGAWER